MNRNDSSVGIGSDALPRPKMRDVITAQILSTLEGLLRVSRESSVRNALLLLIGLDLAFIFLHLLRLIIPGLLSVNYSLAKDHGFPEWYQYIKESSIVCFCILNATLQNRRSFFVWVPLFVYLLMDDSLSIHETAGSLISNALEFPEWMGLRAQDLGEITVSLMAGSIFLPPIIIGGLRADARTQWMHLAVAFLVGVLVFFGVIVDMVHSLLTGGKMRALATIVEDGGEMVAVSLIVAFLFGLTKVTGVSAPKRQS